MALTPEQQSNLEAQLAFETERFKLQKEAEMTRIKAEMIRTAKEALVQNKLSLPVDQRAVTAEEIIAYAQTLTNHVSA